MSDLPDTTSPVPPLKSADKPMTRRGCLLGLAVWLVVLTVPFSLVLFAMRGEVSWRRGDLVEDRLWLVNSAGSAGQESAAGVAYSATRLAATSSAAGTRCARTHVYFLLWRGASEAVDYCECYQPRPAPQTGYESIGACP